MQFEFDGVPLPATLLEDESRKASKGFARLLPLSGLAANSGGSAAVTCFFPDSPAGGTGSRAGEIDRTRYHLLWSGRIYFEPTDAAIRARCGAAAEGMQGNSTPLIRVACLDGDLAPYVERARHPVLGGVKPLSIPLPDAEEPRTGTAEEAAAVKFRRGCGQQVAGEAS